MLIKIIFFSDFKKNKMYFIENFFSYPEKEQKIILKESNEKKLRPPLKINVKKNDKGIEIKKLQ